MRDAGSNGKPVDWDALAKEVRRQKSPCLDLSRGGADEDVVARQSSTVQKILEALRDRPGVVLADEVGMGKTYVAMGVAAAVLQAGGRVHVSVPQNVLQKWLRDLRDTSGWAGSGKVRETMANPIPLLRYSDLFWYRAGLECLGGRSCKGCPRHDARRGICTDKPRESSGPLPLLVWHERATQLQFRVGRTRRTSTNRNVSTYVASSMARSPVASQRQWWGEPLGDTGLSWETLVARLRKEGSVGLPKAFRSRLEAILQGKSSARKWWEAGSKANRELAELVKSTSQEVWFAWAGVPDLLILDEAHKGKGEEGILTNALEQYRGSGVKVLALTATPFDLSPKELGRILDRIWIGSSVSRGDCQPAVEQVTESFRRFGECRSRFVEEWDTASAACASGTLAGMPPDLLPARAELVAARSAYERALGPWMIRHHKKESPPYDRFVRDLCTVPGEANCHRSLHAHRKYDHGSRDVIRFGPEDHRRFLQLERLELETREALKTIVHSFARDEFESMVAAMTVDCRKLIGTTRFQFVGNDFEYLTVEDYRRSLLEVRKVLENRNPKLLPLLVAPLRLARELKSLDSEHERTRHPRILRAFDIISELCPPIDRDPAKQQRKVLLFSFNKQPLIRLERMLQAYAAHAMYPSLKRLMEKAQVKMHAKPTLPRWCGREDELRLRWGKDAPPREELATVFRTPDHLRDRDTWRRKVEAGIRSSKAMRTAVEQGASKEVCDEIVACGCALTFAPLNMARWVGMPVFRPTADSLWTCSSCEVDDTLTDIFKHASSRAGAGDGGMLADGGTYDGEHEDEGGSRSQCIRADFSNIGKLTSDRLAWCNAIHGDSASAGERWALQLLFNASAPPHVLLAQSTICKEGIDLHRQCRHVIHYDFEWGAGAMEQREGRVDRVNSQWEREYRNWREQRVGEPPRIEVFALRLDGHYDDRRWSRVRRRQTELAAGMGASIVSDSDSDVKDLKPFDDPSVIEELLPDFRHPSGFPKAPRPLAGARLATGKGDSGQGG